MQTAILREEESCVDWLRDVKEWEEHHGPLLSFNSALKVKKAIFTKWKGEVLSSVQYLRSVNMTVYFGKKCQYESIFWQTPGPVGRVVRILNNFLG